MTRVKLTIPEADLRILSLKLEQETGFDSIQTVEMGHYSNENGGFRCPMPGCFYTTKNSVTMWKHMHFGYIPSRSVETHELSFGQPFAKLVIAYTKMKAILEEFVSDSA